jgi:hypothetical protein
VTATGRFRGEHGRLTIDLTDGSSVRSVRSVTFTLSALGCRDRGGCLKLGGRLIGTLVGQPSLPDRPATFAINAAGKVRPIGLVRGTGVVHGTGFIAGATETLQLRLIASGGQITIDASSGPVSGPASP